MAAVNAGRLDDFIRHIHDVLSHVENTDCSCHPRDDQGPQAVNQLHLPHDQEHGDWTHLRRDQHGCHAEIKQCLIAREPVFCKRKTSQGAEKQGCDRAEKRGEHAVIKVLPEVRKQFEKTFQVPQGRILKNQGIESADALPCSFQCNHAHPYDWEHGKYNYDDKQRMYQYIHQLPSCSVTHIPTSLILRPVSCGW